VDVKDVIAQIFKKKYDAALKMEVNMFIENVVQAVRFFEENSLSVKGESKVSVPDWYQAPAKISFALPDYDQAQAVYCVFNRCMTNRQKYGLSTIREGKKGIISIFTGKEEADKKISAEFIKTLKKAVIEFSDALSQSWSPCTKKEVEENPFLDEELAECEMIQSKRAEEGSQAMLRCLNREKGHLVTISGVDMDFIGGSEEKVKLFLGYLGEVGESLRKELADVKGDEQKSEG